MARLSVSYLKEFFAPGNIITPALFHDLLDTVMDNAPPTTLTISAGVVTRTQRCHRLETEGAAVSDDLVTINGYENGQEIFLILNNSAHAVTVKSTGNISVATDCALSAYTSFLWLFYNSLNSKWVEILRSA